MGNTCTNSNAFDAGQVFQEDIAFKDKFMHDGRLTCTPH